MLQQAEINELLSTNFLNKIDDHLTIISEIRVPDKSVWNGKDELVFLHLNVYYDGEKMTTLCFNLMNYDYEDIVNTAKNIKSNEFLLREVDDYLSGDIE